MHNPRRFVASLIVGMLVVSGSLVTNAFAANYPPSRQSLIPGKPIIKPVPVQACAPGATAVVPTATSRTLPLVVGAPISIDKAKLSQNVLTPASVQNRPVRLAPSLILGGIKSNSKAPKAVFDRGATVEVQTPVDVPTVIVIKGLVPTSLGTISFIKGATSAKKNLLGSFEASKAGTITIPAITFRAANVCHAIAITTGAKSTTFAIRSVS